MFGLKSQLGLSLFEISVTWLLSFFCKTQKKIFWKKVGVTIHFNPVKKKNILEIFLKVSTFMFHRRGIGSQVWNETRMIVTIFKSQCMHPYRKHTEAPTLIDC